MSPILKAGLPKKSPTCLDQDDDWLNFLDEKYLIVEAKKYIFPKLAIDLVEGIDGNWSLENDETGRNVKSFYQLEPDIVDDIDSPVMPPKNQFTINLIVKKIERGRPSICDEIE